LFLFAGVSPGLISEANADPTETEAAAASPFPINFLRFILLFPMAFTI
jgi:hypothetical protein